MCALPPLSPPVRLSVLCFLAPLACSSSFEKRTQRRSFFLAQCYVCPRTLPPCALSQPAPVLSGRRPASRNSFARRPPLTRGPVFAPHRRSLSLPIRFDPALPARLCHCLISAAAFSPQCLVRLPRSTASVCVTNGQHASPCTITARHATANHGIKAHRKWALTSMGNVLLRPETFGPRSSRWPGAPGAWPPALCECASACYTHDQMVKGQLCPPPLASGTADLSCGKPYRSCSCFYSARL